MVQISSLLSNEKWGDKEISTFSDGNYQETAARPDTLAYEYIREKICAVSSSVYLPFRGRFSNAQRPDGLEVTPASAGILCSLSKYLDHLENNPQVLACSIQISCKDLLPWGCFH